MHAGVRMCSPKPSGIYTALHRCRYPGTLAELVIIRITFPHLALIADEHSPQIALKLLITRMVLFLNDHTRLAAGP
jgi:hypothetical protein